MTTFLPHILLLFECWWEILRNSNKFTRKKRDARAGCLVNDDCGDDGIRLAFFAQNLKQNEMRRKMQTKQNNSIQISLFHYLSLSIQTHHCLSCVAFDVRLTFCSNYVRFKSIYWNLWIKFHGNVFDTKHSYWYCYARMDGWIIFSFLARLCKIKLCVFFCINFDTVLINV